MEQHFYETKQLTIPIGKYLPTKVHIMWFKIVKKKNHMLGTYLLPIEQIIENHSLLSSCSRMYCSMFTNITFLGFCSRFIVVLIDILHMHNMRPKVNSGRYRFSVRVVCRNTNLNSKTPGSAVL